MNMLAILIAAYAIREPLNEKTCDWLFIDAQEQFVISTVRREDRKNLVPKPIAKCFNRLGSQYFKVRERASNDLRKMDRDAVTRWLFWCQSWKDPEIMLRCGSLLHEFSRCENCKGSGVIVSSISSWSADCGPCLGFGHHWFPSLLCDRWE